MSLKGNDILFKRPDMVSLEKVRLSKPGENSKKKILESLLTKAQKKRRRLNSIETEENDIYKEEDHANINGFTVIGREPPKKYNVLSQYLPNWISQSIPVSNDLKHFKCPIENVGLDKFLVEKLLNQNITDLFPVQAEVIPWMLNDIIKFGLHLSKTTRPRDMCVSVPTGSGKTLAYVLPIIQALSKRVIPKIRAVIVAPVQELVIQIAKVFKVYCAGTKLRVLAAVGGRRPLHLEQKRMVKYSNVGLETVESLVDILVITPGRLVEHLVGTKGFDLSSLRYLVMDEADRMLDNMQNEWLHRLENHLLNKQNNESNNRPLNERTVPQKLLFSATLSQDPELLKKLNLFNPILFCSTSQNECNMNADWAGDTIGSITTPLELKEKYIVVDPVLKPLALCDLIARGWRHILCFTKSAESAHKLSLLLSELNPALKICELSSLLPSGDRDKMLNDFSIGSVDMLVCSDVMARGIDINCVKFVISYDPPKYIQSYIHRVGRTGRGGMRGTAVTLVSPLQVAAFNEMLSQVNKYNVKEMALNQENINSFKEAYRTALQKLKQAIKKENEKKVHQIKLEKSGSDVSKKWRMKKKKLKSKVKKV